MKIFSALIVAAFAVNIPNRVDHQEANSFLSRKRRGKMSTAGKVLGGMAIGAGAAHMVNSANREYRPVYVNNGYPPQGYNGYNQGYDPRYQQQPPLSRENQQEMEEIREEPEEEREGPFNLLGWMRPNGR